EQLKKVISHKESKQRELRNAVTDWLITDSHSLIQQMGKPPCYVTIKRDIGFGYQVAFQAIKEIIIQTCDTAAITTDLWIFRAKSGYIGITCHWLTEKMELYDVLICVEQINYPHT
ncbi:6347_t:CDS:2, partial [Funneliformis geosporum]